MSTHGRLLNNHENTQDENEHEIHGCQCLVTCLWSKWCNLSKYKHAVAIHMQFTPASFDLHDSNRWGNQCNVLLDINWKICFTGIYISTQHWAVWVAAAKSVQSIDILAGVAASPEASNLCEAPIRNRQVGESDAISQMFWSRLSWRGSKLSFLCCFLFEYCVKVQEQVFFRRYTP